MNKHFATDYSAVVYFTQLMGLAFGHEPRVGVWVGDGRFATGAGEKSRLVVDGNISPETINQTPLLTQAQRRSQSPMPQLLIKEGMPWRPFSAEKPNARRLRRHSGSNIAVSSMS